MSSMSRSNHSFIHFSISHFYLVRRSHLLPLWQHSYRHRRAQSMHSQSPPPPFVPVSLHRTPEHFILSLIPPSTVEGDFRASAVDGRPVREVDLNKSGLRKYAIARRCVTTGKGMCSSPGMSIGHILYWVLPSHVQRTARRRYRYP